MPSVEQCQGQLIHNSEQYIEKAKEKSLKWQTGDYKIDQEMFQTLDEIRNSREVEEEKVRELPNNDIAPQIKRQNNFNGE